MFSYARFVDRDTLMRHYGGGIGHFDNTPFSEDDSDNENMDIDDEVEETSDHDDQEADTLDSRHTSGLDNGGSSDLESDSDELEGCSSSESESDLDNVSDCESDIDEELVSF
jgi:hypothetical protein